MREEPQPIKIAGEWIQLRSFASLRMTMRWCPTQQCVQSRKRKALHGLCRPRHFAHEREQIPFCITEERHPEVVGWHLGNHVRFVLEFRAGVLQAALCRANVADLEIK